MTEGRAHAVCSCTFSGAAPVAAAAPHAHALEPRELAPVTLEAPSAPPVPATPERKRKRGAELGLSKPRAKRYTFTAGGLVLGAGLLAGTMALLMRRKANAAPLPSSPSSPSSPSTPTVPTTPATPPTTTPATPEPPLEPPPPPPLVPSWAPDGKTLNRLEGHRRATTKEVGPEARKLLPELLKAHEIGELVPFNADGKRYVAAFETHTFFGADPTKPSTPHKGISLWVPK